MFVPIHNFFCSLNIFSSYIIILSKKNEKKSVCKGKWEILDIQKCQRISVRHCLKLCQGRLRLDMKKRFLPRGELSTGTESPGKWENQACQNWGSICSWAHSVIPGNCVVQGQNLDLMILVDPFLFSVFWDSVKF